MTVEARAPLAGITVLGLEQAIAAPLCTRHLADLGARGFALNQVLHAGEEPVPLGMASSVVAPCSAYPTADGQTAVLAVTSDREWRRLTRDLLGRPELADDPRYAHNADRVRHRAELDQLVGTWCAGLGLAEIQRRADTEAIRAEVAQHERNTSPTC